MSDTTGNRRGMTLAEAAREFCRHPSRWLLGGGALAAAAARVAVGDWQPTDALVPVAVAAAFPFFEWMIHVFILHWRPRTANITSRRATSAWCSSHCNR